MDLDVFNDAHELDIDEGGLYVYVLGPPGTSFRLVYTYSEYVEADNYEGDSFVQASDDGFKLLYVQSGPGERHHKIVRLNGEEFELLSDPFPEAGGIAVNVKTKKNSTIRVLRLPATILQSVRGRVPKAA
jgi:dipeptidyl aminopeptidase/acylaminoacyl peptidase